MNRLKIQTIQFFAILVLECIPFKAYSDEYIPRFIHYSNSQGFNQNTVTAIEQDKYGLLWIGTANGLISYDGYTFHNLTWELSDQSVLNNTSILDLYSDRQGLLWIVASGGLNIYYPERNHFFRVATDSLSNFRRIIEDNNGNMMVLGENFISLLKAEIYQDTVHFMLSSNILPSEDRNYIINDLFVVDDNHFLIATSNGIYKMSFSDGIAQPTIEPENSFPLLTVHRIISQGNFVWIATSSGLYKTVIDGSRLHILNRYSHDPGDEKSIADNKILDLLIGNNNELWIGTMFGGLSKYNKETDDFNNYPYDPRNPDGISSSNVNCIYEDEFDVVWIGTGQGGLCKLDLHQKEFINLMHNPFDENTISGNLINSILEDNKGFLWIASWQKPLSRSNESLLNHNIADLTFRRYNDWFDAYYDKNLLTIFEDEKGFIWLGYTNSIVIIDPVKERFIRVNLQYDKDTVVLKNVWNITQLKDGRILIAGGPIVLQDDPWQYLNSKPEVNIPVKTLYSFPFSDDIITLHIDRQEKIWVGFWKSGLSVIELKADSLDLVNHYLNLDKDHRSINNNQIFTLHEDREANLWIGTFGGGLNWLEHIYTNDFAWFYRLPEKNNLPSNALYGILAENDSIFWISTDMGVCRFNSLSKESTNYNINDGIASNNFRRNAFFKGKSGYYYFGGLNGLTIFRPENIKPNKILPEVKLISLKLNNREVNIGERINKKIILDNHISEQTEIRLDQFHRSISLGLRVHHNSSPHQNRLAFILEGFDKEWKELNTGICEATYNNLPPGKYIFRAKGFNGDGMTSENEINLAIVMIAPWYKRQWSIILFILIPILITTFVNRYYIKVKSLQQSLKHEIKDKEREQEINQAKLRFFTNISHEFKTPLALITIPLQHLKESLRREDQKKSLFLIEKNTRRLTRLIDQLLTFRKVDQDHMELQYSKMSLESFLYPITEAFESYSIKKGIQFYLNVRNPGSRIILDIEKMEHVLYNLLSNAFKFTPRNGTVILEGRICQKEKNKFVCFEVMDDGPGIDKKDLPMIFESFYQSDSEFSNLGIGIGLSFSKSIIDLHHGNIEVESLPGKGSKFSVFLPLLEKPEVSITNKDVKRINAEELIGYEVLTVGSYEAIRISEGICNTLLVVDDEEDFREMIRNIMEPSYRVLEASDGIEALEMIRANEPELIICDVMMPRMDGYKVCKEIKMDIRLCHIPVILLTAFGDLEKHMKGLELGADSYISKPFNPKYLKATVQNLIETREKIKEHFEKTPTIPDDLNISRIDRDFVNSINQAIEKNMENSNFGVEELSRAVNMSTSQLYRKLKRITGQIPNSYLRNFRLLKAAELLRSKTEINMKSVMYRVGMESASHFSHSFKKKFGYSPSDFLEKGVKIPGNDLDTLNIHSGF